VEAERFVLESSTDWWQILAVLGTLAAAIFAAWAAAASARSAKAAEEVADLERQRREEERLRGLTADVSASIVSRRLSGSQFDQQYLRVVNRGPAVATDLLVEMPTAGGPGGLEGDVPRELRAPSAIELAIVVTFGTQAPRLQVSWTDGTGPHILAVPWSAAEP
jgi:hypothetical protein